MKTVNKMEQEDTEVFINIWTIYSQAGSLLLLIHILAGVNWEIYILFICKIMLIGSYIQYQGRTLPPDEV